MRDKVNRKLFFRASDSQDNLKHFESRKWFLFMCHRHHVCPKTLRSKTVHPPQFSQQAVSQWNRVQWRSQKDGLKVAYGDLEGELETRRDIQQQATRALFETISDRETKVVVMEKLKQRGRSAFKMANNDHRGKLLSLLVEAKKTIPKELERSANGSLSAYSGIDLSNTSTLYESTTEATTPQPGHVRFSPSTDPRGAAGSPMYSSTPVRQGVTPCTAGCSGGG